MNADDRNLGCKKNTYPPPPLQHSLNFRFQKGETAYASTRSLISPPAYAARSAFLSNLPTLVLGTSSMKAQRSGIHHLETCGIRYARICSGVACEPGFSTTQASGRSSHFGSGTPITAASRTSGWPMIAFSSSTEEIHS